jgi:hypothetical protein
MRCCPASRHTSFSLSPRSTSFYESANILSYDGALILMVMGVLIILLSMLVTVFPPRHAE